MIPSVAWAHQYEGTPWLICTVVFLIKWMLSLMPQQWHITSWRKRAKEFTTLGLPTNLERSKSSAAKFPIAQTSLSLSQWQGLLQTVLDRSHESRYVGDWKGFLGMIIVSKWTVVWHIGEHLRRFKKHGHRMNWSENKLEVHVAPAYAQFPQPLRN
jgi:hypothetical protein